jgi:hypothetical protein
MKFMNLGEFTGTNVYIKIDVNRVKFKNCQFIWF